MGEMTNSQFEGLLAEQDELNEQVEMPGDSPPGDWIEDMLVEGILSDERELSDLELKQLAYDLYDIPEFDESAASPADAAVERHEELQQVNLVAREVADSGDGTVASRPLNYSDPKYPRIRQFCRLLAKGLRSLSQAAKDADGQYVDPAVRETLAILKPLVHGNILETSRDPTGNRGCFMRVDFDPLWKRK